MKKLDNILIIGIGNNTRQDDGLGWCFLDSLLKEGYNEENLLYKYQFGLSIKFKHLHFGCHSLIKHLDLFSNS